MDLTSSTSSTWIQELERQLHRSRHVILHGNVRDQALLNGKLVGFEDALNHTLESCGYVVRASFNQVDGIVYATPETRAQFDKAWQDPKLSVAPADSGYSPPTLEPTQRTGDSVSTDSGASQKPPECTTLDLALPIFRSALRNNRELTCAIVYFSDRLFQSDEHQSKEERKDTVQLSLIASEARKRSSGGLMGLRNALILVAPSLGAVPKWLYRNNPYFSLVSVEPPGVDERKAYLSLFSDYFYMDPQNTKPDDKLKEEFAALTDGLSYHDLESIRFTSNHEKLKLQEPRRLIDFFKHGRQDDPWEKLGIEEIRTARDSLAKEVIGQSAAIDAVCNILISARGGIDVETTGRRLTRPKGALFFVGPTGVGKTELAKTVTQFIFHDSSAFGRFDMSEYHEEHNALRLTGAPPSYVGYEAGGQLTNWVKLHPFSVILFDEIEKAHPAIMDKFLQVLDDGRLTDGTGTTVYFSQSLIVFTSNIGSTEEKESQLGRPIRVPTIRPDMTYKEVGKLYREAVRNHFIKIGRPEILGRIGDENIIVFDIMRSENVPQILQKFLSSIASSVKEKYGLRLDFDGSIVELCQRHCAQPQVAVSGYRSIRTFVKSHIIPPLNGKLLDQNRSSIGLRVLAIGDTVDIEDIPHL